MGDTLGFKVKEGEQLAEIISLEERRAERVAHEVEKKRIQEEKIAQRQA